MQRGLYVICNDTTKAEGFQDKQGQQRGFERVPAFLRAKGKTSFDNAPHGQEHSREYEETDSNQVTGMLMKIKAGSPGGFPGRH